VQLLEGGLFISLMCRMCFFMAIGRVGLYETTS
jgi:hypothetical protein